MSLDVYLTLPGPSVRPAGIFVRREGATVEISREEFAELYPDRDPVALIAQPEDEHEVFWANITHNLSKMADECGLHDPLWAPEEIAATHARDLVEPLRKGLDRLRNDRERLLQFNPPNGWGNYELLVSFTENYLAACEEHPDAEVRVSK